MPSAAAVAPALASNGLGAALKCVANQKALEGELDAFNEGYDKSQQYVDDGESEGCFFIY